LAILIGQTVSHYEILGHLGSGGMGVVYKARDLKLDRPVALKFLPPDLTRDPDASQRFVQEAKAASALQHNNICTIHDIDATPDGALFIVMDLYDGETLKEKIDRGPLPVDQAIDLAVQIAQGLSEAHRTGIVHRDIKPANIHVTKSNVAKLLDFGLAKLGGQVRLTRTASTLGTAAYMSPEQARAEDIDHRTDIWSLGVVLYEMITGHLPFQGEHEQAVIYLILTKDPAPLATYCPAVSGGIQRIVTRALQKDRANRYPDVNAFIQELRDVSVEGGGPREQKKSIVVLPFEDISPGKDNEYFSDGLTEEIITDLSRINELRVISRTSAMMLKGTRKATTAIAHELNVQYVLEGSVRKAGNNLRITAQLIDAAHDVHLWAEKYSGTLDDVFDIQERVSRSIVASLRVTLSPEIDGRISERPIPNVHAYECYLRAKRDVESFTEQGLTRALRNLEKGLEIIGENALLYAGQGYVYWQYVNLGLGQADYLEKAEGCVQKAFALDPESPQAHFVLGMVKLFSKDQRESARHFKRALAANPNDPDALGWLASICFNVGKLPMAYELIDRMLELVPLNSLGYIKRGIASYFDGRFTLALESAQKSLEVEPENASAPWFYALYSAALGRTEEALAVIDRDIDIRSSNVVARLAMFLRNALRGDQDLSGIMTDDFVATARRDNQWSCYVADFLAALGRKAEALDWLENAIEMGFVNYPFLSHHDPFLENIRGEERFKKLMERTKHEWENFVIPE